VILAVNIGNTNIRVALEGAKEAVFYTTENFDAAFFLGEIENGLGAEIFEKITGSIVASVVPQNTEIAVKALKERTKKPVKTVKIRDLEMFARYEGLLGDDRAVCCLMALKEFPPPLIIVDCGTATTINVVNADGKFLGGAILAGLQTSLNTLTKSTAQLPVVEYSKQEITLIGKNTTDCMLSGAVIGLACAIDGFVGKIGIGKVIITGGHAPIILPYLTCEFVHKPSLLLDGLFNLYKEF
jgi:type III pantothenate kinase